MDQGWSVRVLHRESKWNHLTLRNVAQTLMVMDVIRRYGKFVATHPLKVMGVAVVCCILCGLGLVDFRWVIPVESWHVNSITLHRRKLQSSSTDQRQTPTNSTILKTAIIWRIRCSSVIICFCLEFFVLVMVINKILSQFRSGENTISWTTNGCITWYSITTLMFWTKMRC